MPKKHDGIRHVKQRHTKRTVAIPRNLKLLATAICASKEYTTNGDRHHMDVEIAARQGCWASFSRVKLCF